MLNLKKVAVTGQVATGKSTVCQILKEEANAYVISADEIVHQLLSSNPAIIQQVIELLGSDILTNDHIDRKKVADKVFSNEDQLKALETILHPAVKEEINKSYQAINQNQQFSAFVAEVPLLYEGNFDSLFDIVIVVTAKPSLCKTRFNGSEEEYDRRMKRLTSIEEKNRKADYVIDNSGDLETLRNDVKKGVNLQNE